MNYHKKHLPELLAPAGSFEHLKAAVLAGADAVYFGGSRFGARAYAENFTKEKVIEGLDFLHFHDRRAYMTVNTLIKENELQKDLYDYLLPFYEAGLDGVIVQDLGAASFIRDHFPGMEVHGSTQMMITNVSGAEKAKEMGMNRIVPARELSMEEVSRIKKETGLEIEVFIHGALCYCYSGQCLFSSTYGGRSGNRGRCAQPCRLPYRLYDADHKLLTSQEKHLLSPKDLYSLHTLPSMIEHGVDSLKIEGRMKNVEYVAGVTSIYRKYLDSYDSAQSYVVNPQDEDMLTELYSRSGFTKGYWIAHNGKDMMSIDTPRHLGLPVGEIRSIRKNKLLIALDHQLHSKDLLVIAGGKEDELVLTVPSDLKSVMIKKKKGWEITLNAPKTRWIREGLKVYRRYNQELQEHIQKDILSKRITYPVSASIQIQEGEPVCLSLASRDDEIRLQGDIPSQAQNRPIEEKDILKQMKKTGNVPFHLEKIDIHLEDDLFLQASSVKELRQNAYAALEEAHKMRLYRQTPVAPVPGKMAGNSSEKKEVCKDIHEIEKKEHIAAVYNETILSLCLKDSFFHGIVLSMDFYDAQKLSIFKDRIHQAQKKAYLSLPHVLRQESKESLEEFLFKTMSSGSEWDAIYINNINELSILDSICPKIPRIYASSFYQWNQESRAQIKKLSKDFMGEVYWEFPLEMSREECISSMDPQANDLFECLIYGRFPVMVSAQCPKKTLGICNAREEILYLEDRKKRLLPVSSHCKAAWTDASLFSSRKTALSCYNMIWTDQPRNLIGEDLQGLLGAIARFRFDLFETNPEELKQMISSYKEWEKASYQALSSKKLTEDHWNHGIE